MISRKNLSVLLIKLGSKVDLYLPEGVSPVVTVGAKVKAGKTAIGVRK